MKNMFYLMFVIVASILLVGCNTGETGNSNSSGSNVSKPNVTDVDQQEPEVNDDETNSDPEKTEDVVNEENTLNYLSKGKEVSGVTKVVESNNQNFTVAILPDFTLSAEEPGKDVILYNGDDRVSMRIETVSVADSNYDDMLESTREFMNASSRTGTVEPDSTIATFAPTNAIQATGFKNEYEEEITTVLLFETDKLIVRLTVFDQKEIDLTEALLKMGATVKSK